LWRRVERLIRKLKFLRPPAEIFEMSASPVPPSRASSPGIAARLRRALPHGGSLPAEDWRQRHVLITGLLWITIGIVPVYALLAHGSDAVRYTPEVTATVAFAVLAGWGELSRKWRSVAASMGLLTASASLIDISGGLIEMHFAFFVVIVVLTLYEDWVPFLLAVAFVLIHHGVMGTIDPQAVFYNRFEWKQPWLWASIHAMFVALAGIAGVVAWGLNERVRDRMRTTQAELERISLTDPLTSLLNRRSLMTDLEARLEQARPTLLAVFDLDGFKEYNDRFGHPAGDQLLIRLASQLGATVEGSGCAYRLGGDEFCILADPVVGVSASSQLATWQYSLEEHGEGFMISASAGLASLPEDGHTPSEALTVCDRRMYQIKNERRTSAAAQTRNVLLATLAAHNADLGDHVGAVGVWAERVGVALSVPMDELRDLRYAAELHDIGKVAIPDSILSKPGPLDEQDWEFVRRHTIIGEGILAASPALSRVAHIVRSTHERFDGHGYPDGLTSTDIPLAARIITVCDAYDAMVSERPYRRPLTPANALDELARCAGAQFDPGVVSAFIEASRSAEDAGSRPTESGQGDAELPAATVERLAQPA
jgi:diguanylate cyclase (GGDEF)-like protein